MSIKCDYCKSESIGAISRCTGPLYCLKHKNQAMREYDLYTAANEKALEDYLNSPIEKGDVLTNKHGDEIRILEVVGNSVKYFYKPHNITNTVSLKLINKNWRKKI